jgi:tRNA(Met) C34 N-acetyltransferase TmcA
VKSAREAKIKQCFVDKTEEKPQIFRVFSPFYIFAKKRNFIQSASHFLIAAKRGRGKSCSKVVEINKSSDFMLLVCREK